MSKLHREQYPMRRESTPDSRTNEALNNLMMNVLATDPRYILLTLRERVKACDKALESDKQERLFSKFLNPAMYRAAQEERK